MASPVGNLIARRRQRAAAQVAYRRALARRDREWRIAYLEWELGLPGAEKPGAPRIPTQMVRIVR